MLKKKEILFKPISPKRNSEDIALQIENLIISRVYKPNDRLPPERELAIQFKVGRPAVREALRLLEGSGYIRVKPGGDGGIFVKELDSSRITKTILDFVKTGNIKIQDITKARIIIEGSILESCIESLKETEIQALEQNIKKCESLIEDQKSTFGEIQDFHILLASFCNNIILQYFLISLVNISDTYIQKNLPGIPLSPTHIEHHKEILNGIKNKNTDEARKALTVHLASVADHLNKFIK